ncbi:MAG: hypothetical protein ACQEWU_07550 [Bacillota bacterium]
MKFKIILILLTLSIAVNLFILGVSTDEEDLAEFLNLKERGNIY